MRIIGGRDYYDGAGYQFDNSTTFVRKASLVPLDITPLLYSSREVGEYCLYRFDVVVAGEAYLGLRIQKSTRYDRTASAPVYIYDQSEATAFAPNLPQYMRDWCDLSISDARRKSIKAWALDAKVTVAISAAEAYDITEWNRRGYTLFDRYSREHSVLVNSDALKTIEFYRALPPAEANRAIASWVGGVLPFNVPTLQLSDRSKIQKAGFDLRTSFRKAKA
jgi:hypothetical protein